MQKFADRCSSDGCCNRGGRRDWYRVGVAAVGGLGAVDLSFVAFVLRTAGDEAFFSSVPLGAGGADFPADCAAEALVFTVDGVAASAAAAAALGRNFCFGLEAVVWPSLFVFGAPRSQRLGVPAAAPAAFTEPFESTRRGVYLLDCALTVRPVKEDARA